MKIIAFDPTNDEHINGHLRWNNDPELYALTVPVRKAESVRPIETFESVRARYLENLTHAATVFMIYDGDFLVGFYSLQMNPPQAMRKEVPTAWLGLTIGERSHWGSGIATSAMGHFESCARALGAQRIELGTFEFNFRAQNFYTKLGYREFSRLKNFTYHDGRFWDDVRMEKGI